MIAYVVFNYLNRPNKNKQGYVSIQIDIEKAYDRLEWNFIKKTLTNKGFYSNLINTIMNYVTRVSLSILVNGLPSNNIHPTRGIRQGDPLSLYLFILRGDVFYNLIKKAHDSKDFSGMSITKKAQNITHLSVCVCVRACAYESLIFYKTKEKEAKILLNIINTYHESSGLED